MGKAGTVFDKRYKNGGNPGCFIWLLFIGGIAILIKMGMNFFDDGNSILGILAIIGVIYLVYEILTSM